MSALERPDPRVPIHLQPGALGENVAAVERALRGAVFVRGRRLVTVGAAEGRARLQVLDKDALRLAMAQRIVFTVALGARAGVRPVDPPWDLVTAVLASAGGGRLEELRGIARGPVVCLDGRLATRPGYDAGTRLWIEAPGPAFGLPHALPRDAGQARRTQEAAQEVPARETALHALPWEAGQDPRIGEAAPAQEVVPHALTREAAEAARRTLAAAVASFPFVGEADRSVALAAILTVIERPVLPAAPLLAFDAPTPGTGKSKLAAVVSRIATGARAPVMSVSANAEETDKRLDAALLGSVELVVLDNIEVQLGGDRLCSALTEPTVSLRPLGRSEVVDVPVTAAFLATGNNLRLKGDIVRRAVIARLDAGVERPELRAFDTDAEVEAGRRRPALLRAALTILSAYHAAGCPDLGLAPLGSFEAWDRMVRAPLVWAGAADPVATMDRLRSEDPVTGDLAEILRLWHAAHGAQPVALAEVVRPAEAARDAFFDALDAVAGERGAINKRRLGRYLSRHKDRVLSGLRLCQAGTRSGSALWRVVDGKGDEGFGRDEIPSF